MLRATITSIAAIALAYASPAIPQHTPHNQHLIELQARIGASTSENPGEYGIAALDMDSGELIGVNSDMAFPMASTMKIAVAAAYLSDVDAGRRTLADTIRGESAYALMDRMMVRSDNRATDILINHLGGPHAIEAWVESKGVTGMRVDRTIAQLLASKRNLWEHEDTSTPKAMLMLLHGIDRGGFLSASSRATILDMMRRCVTGRNRIKGLMPQDAIVEHKTGTLNGYTSDVGYLTLPDGRRLAVAFFARGGSNRPAVIASAARSIYDGFQPRYAPRPTSEDYSFAQATVQPSSPDSSFGRVTLEANWGNDPDQ